MDRSDQCATTARCLDDAINKRPTEAASAAGVSRAIAIVVTPKQPYADWANGMDDGRPLYVIGDDDTTTTHLFDVVDGDVADACEQLRSPIAGCHVSF